MPILMPTQRNVRAIEAVKYKTQRTFNIISAKVDYEKKVTNTFNFETGAKLSYVNNDYIHYFTRPEMLKAITF
jgi:hypothetical protein